MADEPEKKLEEAAEALKKAEEQVAKAAEDQAHPDASPVEEHERESIEDVREALAYLCEAEGERECDLWLADEAAEAEAASKEAAKKSEIAVPKDVTEADLKPEKKRRHPAAGFLGM